VESDLDVPADYATSIFRLDGRVAVVTGGAGGLGGAIAHGFAQAGATVIIADRDVDRAEKLSTEIGREVAHAYEIDVTSATSVKDVVRNVTQNYGGVDVLVNSAGMATRHPAEDFPEDEWDRIMRVNVKGTFLACQGFGRQMLEQGKGSIINLASIASFAGYPHSTAYLQSKGAVAQMTRSLAIEWIGRGVRVNALAPSIFDTALTRGADTTDNSTSDWVLGRTPIGRRGLPKEIVGPALFLATEASSMVTGHLLSVDGGYTAS
jgi:NAD(P)-dependent dehydrogenase (short-subunit alcohol dehydrogenase family)